MPKVSRRSLIATTAAALTAFAVPAAAAEAEDPEPLALGVEFDKVAVDWVRQRRSDRATATRVSCSSCSSWPSPRSVPGPPELFRFARAGCGNKIPLSASTGRGVTPQNAHTASMSKRVCPSRDKSGRFTGITRKPHGCGRVQKAIRRAFIADQLSAADHRDVSGMGVSAHTGDLAVQQYPRRAAPGLSVARAPGSRPRSAHRLGAEMTYPLMDRQQVSSHKSLILLWRS